MDKPLGPRLPDKRNEAYESIFGRSSTMHHQNVQLQPNSHFNGHIQYHSNLERRPSHSPSFPPSQFPQQSSSQYSSSSTQQYHYPQQTYLHNQPPPSPSHSRTVTSAPNLAVIINPQSDGPPDPALVRSSLPSSHAYQAHVYPTALPPEQVTRYNQSDARPSPDRESYVQPRNGKAPDLPRLGLKIDRDDGNLGIDFASGSNGSGSDHGTDDGSSELPWARNDNTRL
jgi:RHO1 GDP-GTP exchange protein 1/2